MARKAIIIAEDKKSGKWDMLADPSTTIKEQKVMFKKIKADGGKVGDKSYRETIMLFSPGKRYKFDDAKKVLAAVVLDNLTGLNEDKLLKIIKDEGLKVKFDKDHEKTRAAIRKARGGAKKVEPKDEPKVEKPEAPVTEKE